jgi:hypothetical protein
MLEASNRNLKKLLTIVERYLFSLIPIIIIRTKSEDEERLKREYNKLVEGLAQNVTSGNMDTLRAEPGTYIYVLITYL